MRAPGRRSSSAMPSAASFWISSGEASPKFFNPRRSRDYRRSACPPSGGAGGRAVAVQDAAVGAGGGGGAVGVQGDGPAPAVDEDEVVETAQQEAVGQAGGAALAAGDDVVDVAGWWRCGARTRGRRARIAGRR